MQEANTPLLGFIKECVKIDPNSREAKIDVYQRYEKWATDEGQRVLDQPDFGRKLKQAEKSIRDGKIDKGGRPMNAYVGVKLLA